MGLGRDAVARMSQCRVSQLMVTSETRQSRSQARVLADVHLKIPGLKIRHTNHSRGVKPTSLSLPILFRALCPLATEENTMANSLRLNLRFGFLGLAHFMRVNRAVKRKEQFFSVRSQRASTGPSPPFQHAQSRPLWVSPQAGGLAPEQREPASLFYKSCYSTTYI